MSPTQSPSKPPIPVQPPRGSRVVGIDLGTTLAKLVWTEGNGSEHFEIRAAEDTAGLRARLNDLQPSALGLTGGGAKQFAGELPDRPAVAMEFEAWRAGASYLITRNSLDIEDRFLILSVGTGTSVLRVDRRSALRIGGTALGGGTLMGLGRALVGVQSFEEMCALAERGTRGGVDLCIRDICEEGELPLPGDATAACLAKLARPDLHASPSPEDLAAGIAGLVGENIGLISGALAATTGVKQLVLGGTTLRDNPALVQTIQRVVEAYGRELTLLPHCEYVGALGALALARAPSTPTQP